MGEFTLIRRIVDRLPAPGDGEVVGPGDDAAVVEIDGARIVITVDALVDDVHFDRSISSATDVGWKLAAVNVSDLAAMGAEAVAGVVALHLPDEVDEAWVLRLADGLGQAAQRWGFSVSGGDVVSADELAASMTLVGRLHADGPLQRSGAEPGDAVVLLGDVGRAAAGLRLARGRHNDLLEAHPELLAAHRRPRALPEAGRALAEVGAHAAIDVSDGLGQDAGHIARASGVRIVLHEEEIPLTDGVRAAARRLDGARALIGGGEDLALIAAVPPRAVDRLRDDLASAGVAVRRIGEVGAGRGCVLVTREDEEVDASLLGYEHGRSQGGTR